MKRLIVNADDFGFNSNINKGIIRSHKNGIVKNVSLMTKKEGSKEAIEMLKDNPSLDVGIEIDLDNFFVIDHAKGVAVNWLEPPPPISQVKNEIKEQIEILLKSEVEITHICSHHNVHLRKDLLYIFCEIANEYRIRVMRFFKKYYRNDDEFNEMEKCLKMFNLTYPPHYIEGWYWGNIDETFDVAELVTHPGYGEVWREFEMSVCCDPELKGYLSGSAIELITFRDFIKGI